MRTRLLLVLISLILSACGPAAAVSAGQSAQPDSRQDLQGTAQAEATAIIEEARATAIVLQAQAQADALLQQSRAESEQEEESLPSTAEIPSPDETSPPLFIPFTPPGSLTESEDGEEDGEGEGPDVQVLNAGIAAEGGFIIVNYVSSYRKAQDFWPGRVSVTDETSGIVYSEVPVMPIIGPLIARPQKDGQAGYVMFVNNPPILGDTLLTVILDDYVQEHVPFE